MEASNSFHDAPPSSLARRMASEASPRSVSNDAVPEGASRGETTTTPMLADSWCSTPSTDVGRLNSSRIRVAICEARAVDAT